MSDGRRPRFGESGGLLNADSQGDGAFGFVSLRLRSAILNWGKARGGPGPDETRGSSNGREIQMSGKFLHLGTLMFTLSQDNCLQGPCEDKEFYWIIISKD